MRADPAATRRPRTPRAGPLPLAIALAALVLAAAWAPGCDRGPGPTLAPAGPAQVSLLAVGDTGEAPNWLGRVPGQERVAEAMAVSSREAPVSAVLLLGDNFYPKGLDEEHLLERLRANLVGPYCGFLAFTPAGRPLLEDACRVPESERHPVPFLAVLGNHDYKSPDSARLERERIPALIANWTLPPGLVQTVELADGVSVVLLQSQELGQGAPIVPLAEALARARGPWRILVAHHPIEDPGDGYFPYYAEKVHEALARAAVPVQLMVAGHEHNLQVVGAAREGGPLQVVSGGGHEAVRIRPTEGRRLFGLQSPGFARIDLVSGPEGERLEVTLVAVSRGALGWGFHAAPVARFAVDRDGRVSELPPLP